MGVYVQFMYVFIKLILVYVLTCCIVHLADLYILKIILFSHVMYKRS